MNPETAATLLGWAETYNDRRYFEEDPIIFPTRFLELRDRGICCTKDVEVAAVFAAHFAWGRRSMIVRDCTRLFDRMDWKPYDYVMRGEWKDDPVSVHRTVKWSDTAAVCARLKAHYSGNDSLEPLTQSQLRVQVFGQKEDPKAPDKKINMMRRWLVRDDGRVDLGIWKDTDPASLLIPLDVHVHNVAGALGLTCRKQKDIVTVREITGAFAELFPGDPCKGDFALFGYGVTHPEGI
ncbi:MAG: DUF2400 family protein [Candidatus Cryptobacteroides sp.]